MIDLLRPRGGRYVGRHRTRDKQCFLLDRLALSAISVPAAAWAGIQQMTVATARSSGLALPAYCSDGFVIRYHDSQGRVIKDLWRWRNDPAARNGFARITEFKKYGQPAREGCFLYLPRVKKLDWQKLADPTIAIFIVEGELKALSLCLAGVPTVAVGGVWNFANQRRLLPELEALAAKERSLPILFDSDTRDKPQVAGARYALARALLNAKGKPFFIELPHLDDPLSPDKTGADDFVRLHPELKGEKLARALLAYTTELAAVAELYRLNAQYVIDESAARIVRLYGQDGVPADRKTELWTRAEFCGLIENQKLLTLNRKGEESIATAGPLWVGWEARNRVVGRVYQPVSQNVDNFLYVYKDGRRYLNEFCGWASKPKANAKIVADFWTPLLNHLFRQQSVENREQTALRCHVRKWFEQWWAFPVQHPGAKMLNAAVLSGWQGGGKDMVGRAVGQAVYGKHYRLISPAELNTNFNAGYMEAVSLIHAQELTSKNNKRNFKELLKAWLTGPELGIEEKYEKLRYAKSMFNFYMTTNPEDSIHLDWDDRRYFIWRIANARIQEMMTTDWVNDFHKVLVDSEEGRAALHHHLLAEVDCSDFDPNAEPPITEAKQFAQTFSTNEAEAYVAKLVAEQLEGAWVLEDERAKTTFREKEFQTAFRKHLRKVGRADITDTRKLGRKAKRGLWVRRETPADIKARRFVTLAEATQRYEKQAAERAAARAAAKPEQTHAK
jgi:hypothetical protein